MHKNLELSTELIRQIGFVRKLKADVSSDSPSSGIVGCVCRVLIYRKAELQYCIVKYSENLAM